MAVLPAVVMSLLVLVLTPWSSMEQWVVLTPPPWQPSLVVRVLTSRLQQTILNATVLGGSDSLTLIDVEGVVTSSTLRGGSLNDTIDFAVAAISSVAAGGAGADSWSLQALLAPVSLLAPVMTRSTSATATLLLPLLTTSVRQMVRTR